MNGMEMMSPLGFASGLLGFLIMFFFGLLSLLVPFFVWRIWKWSYTSSRQLEELNVKLEHLAEILSNSAPLRPEPAVAPPTQPEPPAEPSETDQEGFAFAPLEKPTNAEKAEPEEKDAGQGSEPEPAPGAEAATFRDASFDAGEGVVVGDTETSAALSREETGESPAAAPAGERAAASGSSGADAVALPPHPQRPDTHLARCGGCGHKLAYKETLSGKRVKCPACGRVLLLP